MLDREVRLLIGKEWKQLLRSRGALATALLLPTLMLLIIPTVQMFTLLNMPASSQSFSDLPPGMPLPPVIAAAADDPRAVLRLLLLPLFVTIGGLLVPSTMATYTLIAERENRTLELLVALPVRVGQILLAKLLVILMLAAGVTFTLFAIDAVLIVALGIGSPAFVAALLLLLLAALAYSTASALLISLLARDFRTANNLNGALVVPTLLLSVALLTLAPGGSLALLGLALVFVLAALAATFIALRVITFERLLR
jgi:ABC-type Na+ efflux pump permease subunit